MRENDDRLDAVRRVLRNRISDLAEALLGQPNKSLSTKRELRWGRKGAFRVHISGPKMGGWTDFESVEKGDPFDLIRHVRQCDFPAALAWASAWAGIDVGMDTKRETQVDRQARVARAVLQQSKAARQAQTELDRKIRIAQFIAGHAIKVEAESVGDRYLTGTRGVPRPAGGWPDAVRFLDAWSDQPSAIAFIATDTLGRVCGLQRVNIDQHGLKISKKSRGAFAETGAVVRLPGPSDGPLLIAEGPETGLSVWAATGFETWISVGSFSRLALPVGRRVVICRDDDPEDSPADKALARACEGWRLAGIDLVIAQPWSARRQDRSDFNDTIKAGGTDAVLYQIEAALYPTLPPDLRRRVTVEEARKQTRTAIGRFFNAVRGGADSSLAMGIRADVGIGKSAAAREEVIRFLVALRSLGDHRTVVFAVPTHVLGSEAIEEFHNHALVRGHGFAAAQWRGRTAQDPESKDQAMCRDLDRVRAAQVAGADVETACCRREFDDGTVIECPFYRECGYQRQKRQGHADAWFVAHEALFTAKPAVIGEPAAVIIDESFWKAGLEGIDGKLMLTVETLQLAASLPGLDGQRQRFLRNVLFDVLLQALNAPLSRQALLAAGLTKDAANEAHALEWRLHTPPELHPGMGPEQFHAAERAAEPNRTARRLARLWKAVAAILEDDGPEFSGWAETGVESLPQGDVRIIRMKGRRTIKQGWQAPTLVTDASLNADLARPFLSTLDVDADVAVLSPYQRINQLEGRSNSKRRLVDAERTSNREHKYRKKHRDELGGTLHKIARQYQGRGLVVSQLAVEEWLGSNAELPDRIDLAHFNAIAGRDIWGPKPDHAGVEFVVIVGRVMPKTVDVERMAEALSGRAVGRIEGTFPRVQTAREMAGGWAKAAEAPRHPDPLCEAIRAEICEGEIIQAIGRGRGVNRTEANPLTIFVLTDLPIGLPVDHLVPAAALDPTPVDNMLTEGGVAYLCGPHAARAYPGLWKTESSASSALNRAKKLDANSNVLAEGGFASSFRRLRYKSAGQGHQRTEAIVDLSRVPDPRQTIEQALGELAEFQIIDEPIAPRTHKTILHKPVIVPVQPSVRQFWLDPIDLPAVPPVEVVPPWLGVSFVTS